MRQRNVLYNCYGCNDRNLIYSFFCFVLTRNILEYSFLSRRLYIRSKIWNSKNHNQKCFGIIDINNTCKCEQILIRLNDNIQNV